MKYGLAVCVASFSDQSIGFVLRANGNGLMDRTDLTGLYTSANTVGLGNLMSFSGAVGASSCESPILEPQTWSREASPVKDR